MGDLRSQNGKLVSVDALVEALLNKVDKPVENIRSGYDDTDKKLDASSSRVGGGINPDTPPKDVNIGAINPYALVEALLGRNIDKGCMNSAKILSDVLQTDYDELFDMKHDSVLFAGLKLNDKERRAERLEEQDLKIINEKDLVTPDLSGVRQLDDLEKLGLKDFGKTHVKMARMQNGKMHLLLHAHPLGRTVSNSEITKTVNELVSPYRMRSGDWTPPNAEWRNMYDFFFRNINNRLIGDLTMFQINERTETMRNFDDPTQGCVGNSWFIAALFSVFWADPHAINRATRLHHQKDKQNKLAIKFFDKGGENNNKTQTVEVNYEIPINNSNHMPMYCRSSDGADIWPSLYEKAFTKWITNGNNDQPDITQTHCGDPVKAMAQINDREPQYYMTEHHSAYDLLGLVRSNCVNFKTINPMCAWTYATGKFYRGSNIVANHAYSVLGYTVLGENQYIVLRNPWGVTEPIGLNSYPGLIERLSPELWHPASLLDHGGLFAIEAEAFRHCFEYIGEASKN